MLPNLHSTKSEQGIMCCHFCKAYAVNQVFVSNLVRPYMTCSLEG